ncbi:hypothetical protein [Variovorax ginsengisoli]|uniref:Uncharacterized protein n=1 Tax=Variovorax ginsengisoli TaxID=363844 RepID=A0ABT9S8P2_9BURK|nr:hypothetical protein [Variovorax ginsengisoli]MDP9900719.1 hypothetical protein [Variovorax ginsengisoli]
MVATLYRVLCEGQPVPETHMPMLRQMLAAFGVIKIQEIGWAVAIQYRKTKMTKIMKNEFEIFKCMDA